MARNLNSYSICELYGDNEELLSFFDTSNQSIYDSSSAWTDILHSHIGKVLHSPHSLKFDSIDTDFSWLNTRPLSLKEDLVEKIIILDFFTYGCINCEHILPNLKKIELEYANNPEIIVIGIHSPKFPNEKHLENVSKAISRNKITHPVINDPDNYFWKKFGIYCWPTVLIIGPTQDVLFSLVGEVQIEKLNFLCKKTLEYFRLHLKKLNKVSLPTTALKNEKSVNNLFYPSNISMNGTSILVSDTGNNRLLLLSIIEDKENISCIVEDVIGNGYPALNDGSYEDASFHNPHGIAWWKSTNVFIADTGNHCIRLINLTSKKVSTVFHGRDKFSSPWDVCLGPEYLGANAFDNVPNISENMKAKIQKVIDRYPSGIWATDFPSCYEEVNNLEFDLHSLGFINLISFVDAVPDLLRKKEIVGRKNKWLIFGTNTMLQKGGNTFDNVNNISENTKENLRKLVDRNPNGIWAADFPSYYKDVNNLEFDLHSLGFTNLISFVDAVPDILQRKEIVGSKNKWLIFGTDALHQKGPNMNDVNVLYIAVAGSHQIWALYLEDCVLQSGQKFEAGTCTPFAGTGFEECRNNCYKMKAAFAQPSGISYSKSCPGILFVADSESSTIRSVSLIDGTVKTIVGGCIDPKDLFQYGDKDGIALQVKLQHPMGIFVVQHEEIYITDSYNHKIKLINGKDRKCTTISQEMSCTNKLEEDTFHEPRGICYWSEKNVLIIADTNNHCLKRFDLENKTVQIIPVMNTDPSIPYSEIDGNRSMALMTTKHDECIPSTPDYLDSNYCKVKLKSGGKIYCHFEFAQKGLSLTLGTCPKWELYSQDTVTISCGSNKIMNSEYQPTLVLQCTKNINNASCHSKFIILIAVSMCDNIRKLCFFNSETVLIDIEYSTDGCETCHKKFVFK